MDDLFGNPTQSEPSENTDETCTKNLLGTGEFVATRKQLEWMAAQEHDWKMQGLANYVLAMPDKLARRRFLDGFEVKHGKHMTDALKGEITRLHRARTT